MHPWEGFQTDFEESEISNTCWAELGFLINGNTTHRIKEELAVNNWCVEFYYMVRVQMVYVPPHGMMLKISTADPHLWFSLRSSLLPYLLIQLNALLYYMGKWWKPFQKMNIYTCKCCMYNIIKLLCYNPELFIQRHEFYFRFMACK